MAQGLQVMERVSYQYIHLGQAHKTCLKDAAPMCPYTLSSSLCWCTWCEPSCYSDGGQCSQVV